MENKVKDEAHNCMVKLRENPERIKEKVYIGCGAGFGGDRPLAALKLLQSIKELDYLILECLAERTLAHHYQVMMSGGDGYDSRISEWLCLLLPLAVERGVCIITNMGAMDPIGAREKVLDLATSLGLCVTVSLAYEVSLAEPGTSSFSDSNIMPGGVSTYLGAAPIVQCLERYKSDVIITSRVADASLFLGPMVYELGWNWNDFEQLAQGSLAAHLLECGCQLTGGFFMHPGDKFRDFSFQQLLDLSLPYAEVGFDGRVCVAKADNSGGAINPSTCAEQLLYEVGDPGAYITPDMIVDFRDVSFRSLSSDKVLCFGAKPSEKYFPEKLLQLVPKECGWKGWGEISYGGHQCVKRAAAAEFLVRSWIEDVFLGVQEHVISYVIGLDSIKGRSFHEDASFMENKTDIRLRMDGLFELKDHAVRFTKEFEALYTNGPAGGGGISTGYKEEIILQKELVEREHVFWHTDAKKTKTEQFCSENIIPTNQRKIHPPKSSHMMPIDRKIKYLSWVDDHPQPAPTGKKIPLYQVAHSRAGDKGNDLNFSIIPHFHRDIERLKMIITPEWVKKVVTNLFVSSLFLDPEAIQKKDGWVGQHVQVEIYEVRGVHSLNVVVRNVLDGGVNCSRRIDRHGKSVSDLILCQEIVLPPLI